MRGVMIWFHEVKGHGYIRTDEDERLYVEREGFVRGAAPVGRCAGLPVELRVEERGGQRVAVDVSLLDDEPGRRARRRSSPVRTARP